MAEEDWEAHFAGFERLVGLSFSDERRAAIVDKLKSYHEKYAELRSIPLSYGSEPTTFFRPVDPPAGPSCFHLTSKEVSRPSGDDELAFLSASDLSRLIASKQVSPVELTRLYLDRLSTIGPALNALVTLTDALAVEQAKVAEARQVKGSRLGPLDGVPWGAKDLLAVKGYPTTWGASPFKNRTIDTDAAVVERLNASGAVLLGKLSLGALASGPHWFGGTTRSPWDREEPSSGSSAGSGATAAAGLVGFSIGSETQGSIISPSLKCGVTGLRPTYGRVSRHGAMALTWTMDKLGPMCRSVEDCAAVLAAIEGLDPRDPSSVDAPFAWPVDNPTDGVRIGLHKEAFDEVEDDGQRAIHAEAVSTLEGLGATVGEWVPPGLPLGAIEIALHVEAAAAFDTLFDDEQGVKDLEEVDKSNWPTSFIAARAVPAVEYLRALRGRRTLIDAWEANFTSFDVLLAPGGGGKHFAGANLTGHPALSLKCGMNEGKPIGMTFVGRHFREEALLAVGLAYEQATDWHTRHPDLTDLS